MKYKSILLLSALILGTSAASAFDASVYASQSKLASGKWVKISTPSEGIYQISYDKLRELGFDTPSKVQVYGYGGLALPSANNHFIKDFPDDVQPVATRHTPDGRILFFGQGDAKFRSSSSSSYQEDNEDYYTRVRNPYDTESYYFLSDAEGTVDIPVLPSVNPNTNLTPLGGHIHVDYFEQDEQNPCKGGVAFHGPKLTGGSKVVHDFSIKDFSPTDKHFFGSFFYKYAVKHSSAVQFSVSVSSPLNGIDYNYKNANTTSDGVISFYESHGCLSFSYPNPPVGETTDVKFTVTVPATSPSYVAEDFVMLRYPRANRFDDETNFLVMNFPENEKSPGQRVVFHGVNDKDLEVWSIDGYTPVAFHTIFSDKKPYIVLNGSNYSAIAFNPSKTFPEPRYVGAIPNQNIHGESTPDMVIITVEEQKAQAIQLADIHRQYQGMDVLVLVHDDIYNEFSSGTHDAMAYRRMAKMFYDRDPKKFRHLMFLGPAHYDNRCVTSNVKVDRLMCYTQDIPNLWHNNLLTYAADTYFGMLDDDYIHSLIHFTRTNINVGRVSTINPGRASQYVEKVRKRFQETYPAQVYNNVLLMAGSNDTAKHSRQANEVMNTIRFGEKTYITNPTINPAMSFTPMFVEAYPMTAVRAQENAITAALNRGMGMFVYIGHGAANFVNNWYTSDVTSTRYTHAPFVMFASCGQFAFDHLSNGMVETMIYTPEGGAIAGVAASRSTYIEQNQMTCVPVAYAYATAGPGETFGDVFRRSRDIALNELELDTDGTRFNYKNTTFRNIMSYNLAGDPAIPVGVPLHSAEITSVNGVSTSGTPSVVPFENAVFKGVVKKGGEIDTDFNGTVRIEVLDGMHTAKTQSYHKESIYIPTTAYFDNDILTVAYGNVVNGEFTANFSVPAPAYIGESYRVVVSAQSPELGTALGVLSNLAIGEFNPDSFDVDDTKGPKILEFYADEPSFQPGEEVSANCTLYAVIDPSESGLNSMSGAISSRTRLTIDGTTQINDLEGFISRRDDGRLLLEAPLSQLSDGTHSVELLVTNNIGLVDRSAIDIVTTRRNLSAEIFVEESPATSYATIDIDAEAFELARLLITDDAGNTVLSKEVSSFPYKWNLKDSNNKDVENGFYRASVLLKSDREYGSTDAARIIVLR